MISVLVPGYPPSHLCAPLAKLQHVELRTAESLGRIVKALQVWDENTSFTLHDISYIFGEDVLDLRERSKVEAVFLSSRNEVYKEIVRLVQTSGKHARIRATSTLYDSDSRDTSFNPFDRYIKVVSEKIREAAQKDGSADYTLVMSFDLDKDGMPPPDRQTSIRKRLEAFREQVPDRIKIFWRPDYWKIEVFICGDDHVVLGFSQDANSSKLHCGLSITERAFVRHMVHWFELYIRSGALLIDPETLQLQDGTLAPPLAL